MSTNITFQPGEHDLEINEVRQVVTDQVRWICAHNAPATVHEARIVETLIADRWGWATLRIEVRAIDGSNHSVLLEGSFASEAEALAEAARYNEFIKRDQERKASEWAAMTNAEQCASMGYGVGAYCGD